MACLMICFRLCALLAILLSGCALAKLERGWTGAVARDFDFYLLQLAWSPVFCCQAWHTGYCRPEHENQLVLHGLWPEYSTERQNEQSGDTYAWPQYCNDTATNDFSVCFSCEGDDQNRSCQDDLDAAPHCRLNRSDFPVALKDSLGRYAPGYMEASIGDHEWIKHGSCSGLSPADYLAEAVGAMEESSQNAESFWLENAGGNITIEQLHSVMPHSSVSLDEAGHLLLITTCWKRTDDGRVDSLVVCPNLTARQFVHYDESSTVKLTAASDVSPSCFDDEYAHEDHHKDDESKRTVDPHTTSASSDTLRWVLILLLVISGYAVWQYFSHGCRHRRTHEPIPHHNETELSRSGVT